MHFWLDVARAYGRVSLPTKTSLNWTIPALTNINVGSFCGTSDELWTSLCPRVCEELEERAADLGGRTGH